MKFRDCHRGSLRVSRLSCLGFEALERRVVLSTTTLHVTTFEDVVDPDDGYLSLREAIIQANSSFGDFDIELMSGTYQLTREGSGESGALTGDLDVSSRGDVMITGVGMTETIIDGGHRFDLATGQSTIEGMGDRVFEVHAGTLKLQDLTVTGGVTASGFGGGIYVGEMGEIALLNVAVSSNRSQYGGGIYVSSTANFQNSSVAGNFANYAGGIYNNGYSILANTEIVGNRTDESGGGGGLYNANNAFARVENSTFANNAANWGGGIYNSGDLTLETSTLRDEMAWSSGGGLMNSAQGTASIHKSRFENGVANFGAGIYNSNAMNLSNSTLSGGTASNQGGGIFNASSAVASISYVVIAENQSAYAGGIDNRGTLSITNSTLSRNLSTGNAGGIGNASGAVIEMINSTLSGNEAMDWGGGMVSQGAADLRYSTLFNNRGDSDGNGSGGAGGVWGAPSSLKLEHTIVAGNLLGTGEGVFNDLASNSVDATSSYNLVGNASTSGGLINGINGNRVGIPWQTVLDANLVGNGGTTPTHALLDGSPAIDAGNPSLVQSQLEPHFVFDQRGSGYTRIAGARIDIGAYEAQDSLEVPPAVPDLLEPNDNFSEAFKFGEVKGFQRVDELSIHESSNDDWFQFTTVGIGTPVDLVQIEFLHSWGDLDLELYNASRELIASSRGIGDVEWVSLRNLPAAEYFARVVGHGGTRQPSYHLILNTPTLDPIVGAPTHLYAMAVSSSDLLLAWRSPSDAVDYFVIERSLRNTWEVIGTVQGSVTQFVDRDFSDNHYRYRVHALKGTNESHSSNTVIAPHLPTTPGPEWRKGDKSVLVIRVDFSDRPGTPVSDSVLSSTMRQVDDYFHHASYGQFQISTFDITPTLRLPQSTQWYMEVGGDAQLRLDALEAVSGMGFVPEDYWSYVVAFDPISAFPYAGRARVNLPGIWLNGVFTSGTTIHEFAHNLGAWHSSLWLTEDGSIGGMGSSVEYGNPFDVVGRSYNLGDLSAFWKVRLEWLDPLQHVEIVSSTRSIQLNALDSGTVSDDHIYAIVLPKLDGRNYWLEFRQNASMLPSQYDSNGVIVNWSPLGDNNIHLLDMRPNSNADPLLDAFDSTLKVGETYSDFEDNIHITPVSLAPGQAIEIVVYLGAQAPGTLHGRVWNDEDRNGNSRYAEQGLVGWRVYVDSNGNGKHDPGELETMTDADGFYAFENQPTGSYAVAVEIPVGWAITTQLDVHSIELELGRAVEGLDFGLFELASLPLELTIELDAPDLKSGFEPAYSFKVTYTSSSLLDTETIVGNDVALRVLGPDGFNSLVQYVDVDLEVDGTTPTVRYRLPAPGGAWLEIHNGTYEIYLEPNSIAGVAGNWAEGRLIGTFNIDVRTTATLQGHLFEDLNEDGAQSAGEEGLENWVVFIDANGNNQLDTDEVSTSTDSEGYYSFTGLSPGDYQIGVVVISNWKKTGPQGLATVSLAAGDFKAGVNFGLIELRNEPPEFMMPSEIDFDQNDGASIVFEEFVSFVAPSTSTDIREWERQNVTLTVTPLDVPGGLMTHPPTLTVAGGPGDWPGTASLAIFPVAGARGQATYRVTASDDDPYSPQSTSQILTINIREVTMTSSRVYALPPTQNAEFLVSWGANLGTYASAVDSYAIYQSKDSDPYQIWIESTTETSALFQGEHGSTYSFYSVATDNLGIREAKTPRAEGVTQVIDATGSIQGQLFEDHDKDGIKSIADTVVSGWTVFIDANGNGLLDPVEKRTETDEFGFYRFSDLVVGEHEIRLLSPERWELTGSQIPQTIRLGAGEAITGVDFGVFQLGRIYGVVRFDSGRTGLFDATASNVQVFIDLDNDGFIGDGEPQTISGLDGSFEFDGLTLGTYVIRTIPPTGAEIASNQTGLTVNVEESGFVATGLNLDLRQENIWHNKHHPLDVDADLWVTPLDALSIINEINHNGSRSLLNLPFDADSHRFYDVDDDGFISPLDVLALINWINKNGSGPVSSQSGTIEREPDEQTNSPFLEDVFWLIAEEFERRKTRGGA